MDHVVVSDLELVGHIYDAVLEPYRWSDTIDRIRRALGLANGAIAVSDLRRQSSVIFASANIPEAYSSVADEHARASLDLWGGPEAMMRMPLEEPLILTEVSPLKSFQGNSYYEERARPQGLVDLLIVILEFSPSMVAYFGMGLHESMPPLNQDHVERLRLLAPHLRRAALISNLLDTRADAAASFEGALNALGSAVLLVDSELQIVYANSLAEQQLRDGDPLAALNGWLRAPHELVRGQLERAVAATTQPLEMIGPGSGIPVRRRDGSGVIVHVLPLQRRSARPTGRAVAAVFVAEPSATLNLPLEGIRALYDLRPAETRVLELVAQGLPGRAVAKALGISENTAKTHTIRLFDKLGLHTRAELVRFARDMSLG